MTARNLRAKTPDGREYDNGYVFVLDIRDGRITAFREHADTSSAVRFFGGSTGGRSLHEP